MSTDIYTREAASIATAVEFGTSLPNGALSVDYAKWIQAVAAGTIVAKNEDGSSVTFVCGAGEVMTGRFREITSASARVRYGNGPVPPPLIPDSAALITLQQSYDEIAPFILTPVEDPGTGEPISVDTSASIALVVAATGETNTLAPPSYVGQQLLLYTETLGSSDTRVITASAAIAADGDDVLTFDGVGQAALLIGIEAEGSLRWSAIGLEGAATSASGG